MGYSALLFYGYVGVIGLALFAALKWWFRAEVGLAQVWCTYGARLQDRGAFFCNRSSKGLQGVLQHGASPSLVQLFNRAQVHLRGFWAVHSGRHGAS